MFVQSDIYDLETTERSENYEWSENLLCGVEVMGREWPGLERVARFFVESRLIRCTWHPVRNSKLGFASSTGRMKVCGVDLA